jgi:hypothetical protein
MKLTDDEVLAIVDEVTVALGEILLSHRQLMEDFLERHGIEQAQDRIEKRRAEIQRERERIGQMKDALRHRGEVERIRKQNEKDAKKKRQQEEAFVGRGN